MAHSSKMYSTLVPILTLILFKMVHLADVPRNCQEINSNGTTTSGIYYIQPEYAPEGFLVVCDMETQDGGWTYFLNRFDGTQNFYLDWHDYVEGFGNLAGEYWLGLERLHQLTVSQPNELLIELEDWDLNKVYARYSFFGIGSAKEGYSLKILGGYSGDAGDSLMYSAGCKFTTKDRDQDSYSENCATRYSGAWWYKNCMHSQLTGPFLQANVSDDYEDAIMYWNTFRGDRYSLKKATMKIKPSGSSPLNLN